MHEALPGSLGDSHSMSDSGQGARTGREVYEALLHAQNSAHKHVYVFASHSHFFMEDVFRTDTWKGKVLPGWIVGTAGAVRYRLPPGVNAGSKAMTDVYGYMVATVGVDGSISTSFQQVDAGRFAEGEPECAGAAGALVLRAEQAVGGRTGTAHHIPPKISVLPRFLDLVRDRGKARGVARVQAHRMSESGGTVAGAAGRVGRDVEDDVVGMGSILVKDARGAGNRGAQVIETQQVAHRQAMKWSEQEVSPLTPIAPTRTWPGP